MTRTLHPCSPRASREDLEKLQRRKEPLDFGQRLGDRTECWGRGWGCGGGDSAIQVPLGLWSNPLSPIQSFNNIHYMLCAGDCSRFSLKWHLWFVIKLTKNPCPGGADLLAGGWTEGTGHRLTAQFLLGTLLTAFFPSWTIINRQILRNTQLIKPESWKK